MYKFNRAFTLIELSIVIVIAGLIVSSVLGGRAIMNGARKQSLIVGIEKYSIAYKTFRLKYKAIPGDMPNAFDYLQSKIGCVDLDVNDDNSGCNGNGDGRIGNRDILEQENLRAYHHITASSILHIISANSSVDNSVIARGQNVPENLYNNSATYYFASDNLWNIFNNINSVVVSSASGVGWDNSVVDVVDSWSIDNKIDDGIPYRGKLIAYNQNDNECVADSVSDGAIDRSSEYLLDTATRCTIRFGLGGIYK